MRALGWLAKGLLFLILFGFALKNTAPVELRFFLGQSWRAPLSLLLFVFFSAGAALGVAAALSVAYRQRKELARLRAEAADPPVPSTGVSGPGTP
jgi:uncharacterized integral membrane protein